MIQELSTHHIWFMYTAVALLSLAVGSLLNVIIYRLPLMLQYEWKRECCALLNIPDKPPASINLFFPRSFCPQCKKMIKAWQNIPLLSYLFLHGQCAVCKGSISMRYPFIELTTMILSLYASWHFGFNSQLAYILIALWLLICLFFIDLDHQILPDSLTLTLLWIGLIANTTSVFIPLNEAVLSAVFAYLGLWFFIKLFYLITGKIGMGNGDFKLFAALGAWFGWKLLPLILLFSSIFGTIIGIIYIQLYDKSKETAIPFGPFLCISGLIALFGGEQIVNMYLQLWL